MQCNHKVGYYTTTEDIISMVKRDFGVEIDNERAKDIIESNNRSELIWTAKKIVASGKFNFTIEKE